MTQDTEDVVAATALAMLRASARRHYGDAVADDPALWESEPEHQREEWLADARAALEASDRQSLSDRIDVLEGALKPFAAHVGKSGETVTLSIGKDTWSHTLSTDDFKRARAALHQEGVSAD